jgi:hypothetical protein
MRKADFNAVADEDVFAITGKGNADLKAPGTQLSTADLQVLVLVDGFSTVAQIAKLIPNITRAEWTRRSPGCSAPR